MRATTQDGTIRPVPGPAGGWLEVSKESMVSGTGNLEGALVETEVGSRLIVRIKAKDKQPQVGDQFGYDWMNMTGGIEILLNSRLALRYTYLQGTQRAISRSSQAKFAIQRFFLNGLSQRAYADLYSQSASF